MLIWVSAGFEPRATTATMPTVRDSLIRNEDRTMTKPRPFRFGVQIAAAESRRHWQEKARTAEGLGYDVLQIPDHFGGQFAVGPALAVAAAATARLRIGTLVLQNDLRHPALLAKEAATLDVLSDGRFELGIGAGGSFPPDFAWTGIPFDPPATRVGRLEESLQITKAIFGQNPVTFAGHYYTITGYDGLPKPVQRPHPPIFVGAGGPRMLSLAAREADIIGLLPTMLPAGGQFRMEQCTSSAVAAQIDLIRRAAPERFPQLEFNILLQRLILTDDTRRAGEDLSREWTPLTPTEILDTPSLLIGTIDTIVERLQERRERLGISYVVVFERDMEAFAPVVARLAGT
jgi:probable F420-dependent oxidoreductase